MRHPAKYTDKFIPIFSDILIKYNSKIVLDPFAGTGKIGKIKFYGYTGKVVANEIEKEWLKENIYNCDKITFCDAEFLQYPDCYFDAICTSPTYGNRMADHHKAKDKSIRNTYTHCLGKELNSENTGKMQWGNQYREKHIKIYKNILRMLAPGGIFILNIKNHIRKGKEIDVISFHKSVLVSMGMTIVDEIQINTSGNRFGTNYERRCDSESIIVFIKQIESNLSNA